MPRKKAKSPAQLLRAAKAAANKSKHHGKFTQAVLLAGVPRPTEEYKFHPVRKWRFDYAWPDHRVAVEINGGGARGRHHSVKGATNDAEKINTAAVMGWRVLVFTVISIKDIDGVAETLRQILGGQHATS